MNSMVLFPASGGSRIARVRALQGEFPFYGELGADPPEAAASWQSAGMALVDDGLMLQYGVEVGDTIRVGRESLAIAGRLLNLPRGDGVPQRPAARRLHAAGPHGADRADPAGEPGALPRPLRAA